MHAYGRGAVNTTAEGGAFETGCLPDTRIQAAGCLSDDGTFAGVGSSTAGQKLTRIVWGTV